ncbi:MAG: DegT/DnrJ/EryC1/StrS family aminotransferase [Anaerolineaceae bacterium]|nr:DegT/DnrJ/EryC1/StrS family aminotransferase [Anaerolineaceae bacterium]
MKIPFLDVKAAYIEAKEALDAAYQRVMDSGWYILGEEVEHFEAEFAQFSGARYCIGVGNGLEALMLSLKAKGIGAGDEVIVPSNTYIASWLAVSQAEAKIVPVEPRLGTYNINPELIEAAITPACKAIMPVHLYGQRAEMDAIVEIANRHDLFVIEDSAQMQLRGYTPAKGIKGPSAAGYSFYPGKNLGAYGDAGCVLSDDEGFTETLRMLRNYGSRKKYFNEMKGHNSRLDPLQAAFLRAKLPYLEAWNLRRARIADYYREALANLPALSLPMVAQGCPHGWHIFAVRHPRRDALQEWLTQKGVGTLIHYPVPPHLSKAYADLGYKTGDFPISEEIHRTVLSLPIGPHLSMDDAAYVAEAVRAFCLNACD